MYNNSLLPSELFGTSLVVVSQEVGGPSIIGHLLPRNIKLHITFLNFSFELLYVGENEYFLATFCIIFTKEILIFILFPSA